MEKITTNPTRALLIEKIGVNDEKAETIEKYATMAILNGFSVTDMIDGAIETNLIKSPSDLFLISYVIGHIKGELAMKKTVLNRSMQ